MPLGGAPQAFEAVKGAAVAAEHMDDEVEVVAQNPFGSIDPFHQPGPLLELALQRLEHAVGNRADVPRVAAGADDEEIGEAAAVPHVEQDDVLRLLVERRLYR